MRGTRTRTKAPKQVVEAEPEEQEEEEALEHEDVEEEEGNESDEDMHDAQENEEGGVRLKFDAPLTWRAGRPIPVGELLRRLQELFKELRSMEQEEVDRESLLKVAKELASMNLLSHKDRGVRAWTACCIVEMFRLCAPDAPYTAAQLKDIFTLFVSTIFPSLSDPSNPYNAQHLHVLKSLSDVKSIVLLTDIPGSSTLIHHLFTVCFDVLSGPSKAENGEELSKNVEHHMTSVLETLVDESQGLSPEIVDVILAQFLRADPRVMTGGSKSKKPHQVDERQSTLLLKEAPPAYNMAKNICNSCPDKMARYISQYFSSVIVDASALSFSGPPKNKSHRRTGSGLDDSDEEVARGPTDEDLHETKKAHRLLRELWRSAPDVLQDIIPQLEGELSASEVQLRVLATETFGDMISGIGAAGPPPPPVLNPAAYPSQSLALPSERSRVYNFLTTPNSPHSFAVKHNNAYQSFISRRNDRSPVIRAAWVTSVGQILSTSAGGVGLDLDEEMRLLGYFADMLIDADERVRLAAIKAVEKFDFHDIIQKLGRHGSVSKEGSVLYNLANRNKDRKTSVRTEAIKVLGKLWGVASGAIAEGSETTSHLLGPIPSRILDAYYINDNETSALIDRVLFESLLPLSYPPLKAKTMANGSSQRVKDSQQRGGETEYTESDIDKIRTERELIMIRDLEPKAKVVLFAKQGNQTANAKYMQALLQKCEEYNGGVMDQNEKEIKQQLTRLIDFTAKTLAEPFRASDDLWKFAKWHDRRSYQLIRFCMAPDSDFKKVYKSIKEMSKRVEEHFNSSVLDTLLPLVYRVSNLFYNRSHVPAIIEFSRTDEKGLGSTAHEVLKEISTKNPNVFKVHVQELCKSLEAEAPTASKPNGPGAVADLKACASFAQKFPDDVPKDRRFLQSMISFALFGTPPKAAKYGVTIVMMTSDKKELHSREILQKCIKDFEYGKGNYLSKLAALSQMTLMGPQEEVERDVDDIIGIAIEHVLLKSRSTTQEGEPSWTDEPDDDTTAKMWALKILANRLRSYDAEQDIKPVATPVYALLTKLVRNNGEISKKEDSPAALKARLRLTAAQLLLKLSCTKRLDALLTPKHFNELALVAQDRLPKVRSQFLTTLMKYLGQDRLPRRFYAIIFLLAFEPQPDTKENATRWLRARAAAFTAKKDTAMEALLARFISLLAHHPDFDRDVENLRDFAQYIIFYLRCVATETNLSLIYHVAQRVKSVQDGIDPNISENLYCLSDLAQAIIRVYEEVQGWSMQAWPGKLRMPGGIFAPLPSHEVAQEIARKTYVPEELLEGLEDLVKESLRTRKRKAGDGGEKARKKAKAATTAPRSKAKATPRKKVDKTPKRRTAEAVPSSERRRSSRKSGVKNYVETSDEENEEDYGEEDEEEEQEDEEEEQEESQTEQAESREQSENPASSETAVEEQIEVKEPAKEPEQEQSEPEEEQEEEPEPEAEASSEPEPQSSPPALRRGGRRTNGTTAAAAATTNGKSRHAPAKSQSKTSTPAKSSRSATPAKAKPAKATAAAKKAKGKATAAPPKAAARSTRATRGRPVAQAESEDSELSDVPSSE